MGASGRCDQKRVSRRFDNSHGQRNWREREREMREGERERRERERRDEREREREWWGGGY